MIAEKLQFDDLNEIKSKWRNLRDAYQKAIKYKRDLEEMGMISKYYEYRHEEAMNFLYDHVVNELNGNSVRKRKGSAIPTNSK